MCDSCRNESGGCNTLLWLIIIFFVLSDNNDCGGCGCTNSNSLFGGNSCSIILILLALSCLFGSNNGFFGLSLGSNCGCGCSNGCGC